MNTCYIFGAAEGLPEIFCKKENDLVIAADAGLEFLEKNGVVPDIAVGDFDSLGYTPKCSEVIKHPVMKNDTDTMLAVKTGFERGYTLFVIYGGTGGRPDHTFANYQTLCYISSHGGMGFLVGREFTACALTNGEIHFSDKADGTVSVFSAVTKTTGVNMHGLLYELENAEISFDFPYGVSNEFKGEPSCITAGNGTLIIMWSGKPTDIEGFLN